MPRITALVLFFLAFFSSLFAQETKKCEFCGTFYPADPTELSGFIDQQMAKTDVPAVGGEIIAMQAPHAGYDYSGSVAAYAYKALAAKKFDTVVILGSTHNYPFSGISIYPGSYFQTPLGRLEVDPQIAAALSDLPFVVADARYFQNEHSLEVEMPFIQKTLPHAKVAAIVFGDADIAGMKQLATRLAVLAAKKHILVLASSDLSHFLTYPQALAMDTKTLDMFTNGDIKSLWDSYRKDQGRACGILPIITMLFYAKDRGAGLKLLKYANSGDTTPDKSKVVGYSSVVAYKEENMSDYTLNAQEKTYLLKTARASLETYLKTGKIPDFPAPDSAALKENRGAFVTLTWHGGLRGCIGRIVGDTPVYKVIPEFAVHAAVDDPRFPMVTYQELKDIYIEISVLTPFLEVKNLDEIEVGKHGLMITRGVFTAGLLLPQVPGEFGWDRTTFLEQVCAKAGLPADAYKDKSAKLEKFSALVFSEEEMGLKE